MRELSKLVWLFWIIVTIVIIVGIVIANPWLLVAGFIVGISLIVLLSASKEGKEKKLKEECDSFIRENQELLSSLTAEYYEAVKNFIETCPNFYFSLGSSSPKLVGYEHFNRNNLCASFLKRDGLPTTAEMHSRLEEDKKSRDNLLILIQGLKSRISGVWTDEKTLDAVVYLVFRNNLIKYFYNQYLIKYNRETIEDFCSTFGRGNVDSSMYTYYYLFKNDINAPISTTFNSICAQVKSTFERMERKQPEQMYFDN